MRYLFVFILFLPLLIYGQHQLNGKVVDSKTNKGLAFVNIVADGQRLGATTGIDGNFVFKSNQPIQSLKLSYVGYEPMEINVSGKTSVTIALKRTDYELMEFNVLPGENPAHRIINNAVDNRKKNNPEKSLNFRYESYSKLFFTAKLDSAILNDPQKFAELDSNEKEDLEWLEKHHIFLIETVTERKYKQPDKSYEKIIASRVSGFKNPIFFVASHTIAVVYILQSRTLFNGKHLFKPNFCQ